MTPMINGLDSQLGASDSLTDFFIDFKSYWRPECFLSKTLWQEYLPGKIYLI